MVNKVVYKRQSLYTTLDLMGTGQPMELLQGWSHVVVWTQVADETSSRILDSLPMLDRTAR